jgi:hypothetical protein
MTGPYDVRLSWFRRFPAHCPMVEPRLHVGELESTHALEVRHGTISHKLPLEGNLIDDAILRETTAEQPLPDRRAEMIEQAGCEPTRCSLDPTAPRKTSPGSARAHASQPTRSQALRKE